MWIWFLFVSILFPQTYHMLNLLIICIDSFQQWFWTLLVSQHIHIIQIWKVFVWIEWDDEYVWLDIPVEYPIEIMNNEPDISVLVQDHKWASVYSILSPCPWCHSSQHISWYHQNTYLPFVEGRMEDHWICHGVVWVLRYHIQWSIHSYRIFWAILSNCSDSINLFL